MSADTPAGSLALLTSARLHDDEPDTGAGVARALLRSQISRLASRRLELLTRALIARAHRSTYKSVFQHLILTSGFSSIETSWAMSWYGATMLRAKWDCACPPARQS